MIVLNNDNVKNELKFTMVGGNKTTKIEIKSKDKSLSWIPFFILFPGDRYPHAYTDSTMRVFEIDPLSFGKPLETPK